MFFPLCLGTLVLTSFRFPRQKFDAVASELGITPKSTRERFRLLSIKMGWKDGPATPKKPTGVTKRTPAKLGSAKKGGKDKVEPATHDGGDDSDVELKKDEDADEIVKDEPEV